MISKISLTLTLVNLFGLIAFFFFLQKPPVVYVDSGKLLNSYDGMTEARKLYNEKVASWKSSIDTLAFTLQADIQAYEKKNLSVSERKLSSELIQLKQRQLAEYQRAINDRAQQENSRMTNEVLNEINLYIKDYGKSKGYQIIMASTEYGNIAYAEEDLDVTADIIAGLNQKYSGKK